MSAIASKAFSARPLGESCKKCGTDKWSRSPAARGRSCVECKRRMTRAQSARRRERRGQGGTGVCDACSAETSLHRDHDHLTGVLRGRLCRECNTTLGNVHDHPPRLVALIAYLKKWGIT